MFIIYAAVSEGTEMFIILLVINTYKDVYAVGEQSVVALSKDVHDIVEQGI